MKLHALAPPGDLYAMKQVKEKNTCCWPLVTIGEEARSMKAKPIMSLFYLLLLSTRVMA